MEVGLGNEGLGVGSWKGRKGMSAGFGFFSWLGPGLGSYGLNPEAAWGSSDLWTDIEDDGRDGVVGGAEVGILEGVGMEGDERGSRIPPWWDG